MKSGLMLAAVSLAAILSGCAVGPNYHRPSAPVPPSWKPEGPWRSANPKDSLPKGEWWTIFNDSELNALEAQAAKNNQTLAAAVAHLDQARSLARVASAGLFPQLNAAPSAERARESGNRPTYSRIQAIPATANNFQIPFNLSYEIDLFGRVRRNLEAANANYQSSAADLENVRLTMQSDLAADFFNVRELDAEIAVVRSAIEYEQKGLDLVQRRHEGGVASGLEVAQQQTVLDSARTQLLLLQRTRAQYVDAIAVLIGTPASSFEMPVRELAALPPAIPAGLPSDVLERRPDVATQERLMASANAQIGVAKAAYFPSISLLGGGGWQTQDVGTLVSAPSAFWSLGIGAVQNIFNGGRTRATVQYNTAGYQASVANYRQTVLTAFQQVEDGLSGLDILSKAQQNQQVAVQDARRALDIANNRYTGGVTTYLDVITAQVTLLDNQRLATQLLGQQMVTSVYLVKALGGGWDAASLRDFQVHPEAKQVVEP